MRARVRVRVRARVRVRVRVRGRGNPSPSPHPHPHPNPNRPANTGKGGNQLGSGWLSIIGGGTILGGLVGIAMYVKHRSRRDALTPAGDDYHRITEPQ